MKQTLQEFIDDYQPFFENEMKAELEHLTIPGELKDSMLYSVQAGGKRLRPLLLFASYNMYTEDFRPAVKTAIALEMIHTYSLIHDDLPAMDDDDYRRGIPTNHKVFGDATAILAGDALLTYSFELIANDTYLMDTHKMQLIQNLSHASGPLGMVGGQFLDVEAENRQVTVNELEHIHTLKTAKLLSFAVKAGALIGHASPGTIRHLEEFSYYIGLLFQVQDDILDVVGKVEKMGKPAGSDAALHKSTYPNLLGLDEARNMKNRYVNYAKSALNNVNGQDTMLDLFVDYIGSRDH